jgi:CMP-N,N'-diacetyllegionaminic acid synthase
MTSVVALVTARGGSKGLPNKNLLEISNFGLAALACKTALASKLAPPTFISSDSVDIINSCLAVGASSLCIRPDPLASDKATDFVVIKHFISEYMHRFSIMPDLLIHLRPTTPQRTSELIDNVFDSYQSIKNTFSSIRTYHESPGSILKYATISNDGTLTPLGSPLYGNSIWGMPRQSLRATCQGNGLVDIIKTSNIFTDYGHYGPKVYGYKTESVIDIDTFDDFVAAKQIIESSL